MNNQDCPVHQLAYLFRFLVFSRGSQTSFIMTDPSVMAVLKQILDEVVLIKSKVYAIEERVGSLEQSSLLCAPKSPLITKQTKFKPKLKNQNPYDLTSSDSHPKPVLRSESTESTPTMKDQKPQPSLGISTPSIDTTHTTYCQFRFVVRYF